MSRDDITTFQIDEDGLLVLNNFEPRTFGEALEGFLKDGWKTSPKKFSKALKKSPDLLNITLGLMHDFFGQQLQSERHDVEKRIAARNNVLEKNTKDGKVAASEDEELCVLYALLSEYDERLWALEEYTPAKWVKSLSASDFVVFVDTIETFFDQPVDDRWSCFTPAFDTPAGAAMHLMNQRSIDELNLFDVTFFSAGEDMPAFAAAVSKSAKELNDMAQMLEIPVRFVESDARAKELEKAKKATQKTEKTANKTAKTTTADVTEKPAKTAKPKTTMTKTDSVTAKASTAKTAKAKTPAPAKKAVVEKA